MSQGEGLRKNSPGLGTAWQFWRAVESGDATVAHQHAELASKIKDLDSETKKIIAEALVTIEAHDVHRNANTPISHSSTMPDKERGKEGVNVSIQELPLEEQVRVLNEILSLLRESKLETALQVFTTIPNVIDRSKVLCSLISHKGGKTITYSETAQEMLQRESIRSTVPKGQRSRIVAAFLKVYFDTLSKA